MHLRIVHGGSSTDDMPPVSGNISEKHVQAEATRRLRLVGFHRAHMRYLATGEPIPKPLQYLQLQIGWVAETLAGLNPIPADYASDKYWPPGQS